MGAERNRTVVLTGIIGVIATIALVAALWRSGPGVAVCAGLAAALGIVLVMRRHLQTGRHTPWAEAEQQLAPGHAVVFWKPGCGYCERLLRAIGDDPRVTWVNVWVDEQANTVVRSHNNGNELTPTALIGDQVLINPSASELRAALG